MDVFIIESLEQIAILKSKITEVCYLARTYTPHPKIKDISLVGISKTVVDKLMEAHRELSVIELQLENYQVPS